MEFSVCAFQMLFLLGDNREGCVCVCKYFNVIFIYELILFISFIDLFLDFLNLFFINIEV